MQEQDDKITMAVINTKLENVISKVDKLVEKLENGYVTKQEFWPVKTIVYGGAGLILTAVFGAFIALIIKK